MLAVLASSPRLLPYLWREWLTSVETQAHRRDVVLLALVLLLRCFRVAIMMRHNSPSPRGAQGSSLHYDQIFSLTERSYLVHGDALQGRL